MSLLYAPVVFGHVAQGVFTSNAQKVLELVIYNVVGWVTGILSQRQRLESEGYKRAAEQLRVAYDKLREQTDLIVEKEEQLRKAEKLSTLGELAGGIAHEVRNPLASIKGTAEILLDESTPKEKRAEFLRLMLDEVNRLNKVVANFLELARFQRLRRETADITDIFQRMLDRRPAGGPQEDRGADPFRAGSPADKPRCLADGAGGLESHAQRGRRHARRRRHEAFGKP